MKVNDRYIRQRTLEKIGNEGQARLLAGKVTIIGCGALGCAQAEFLARAGVGLIRLIDRDFVELDNLHRQILFDENDALERLPKAEAARRRLKNINSDISLESFICDIGALNIEDHIRESNLVLDATDNIETRFLINDACIKLGIPWIYGGVTGTEGLVMPVLPGTGPCLGCVFPEPPPPGSLATCDTAGIINTGPAFIAAIQSTFAQRILVGSPPDACILSADIWTGEVRSIEVSRVADCRCCGLRRFDFLEREISSAAVLCGRNSVQITPAKPVEMDFDSLAERLGNLVELERNDFLLQIKTKDRKITLFPDGRALVHGTGDPAEARVLYARFIGS